MLCYYYVLCCDVLIFYYAILCYGMLSLGDARAAELAARGEARRLQPGRAVLVVLARDEGGLFHVLERRYGSLVQTSTQQASLG